MGNSTFLHYCRNYNKLAAAEQQGATESWAAVEIKTGGVNNTDVSAQAWKTSPPPLQPTAIAQSSSESCKDTKRRHTAAQSILSGKE